VTPRPSPLAAFLPEIERLLEHVSRDDAPALLGEIERWRALLWLRVNELNLPATVTTATAAAAAAARKPDRLLTVSETATVLGVKPRWVREHADEIGAKVRLPGKVLRFSERKLERWIEQRTT